MKPADYISRQYILGLLSSISLGAGSHYPTYPIITPDGRFVLVPMFGDAAVLKVDLTTETVVASYTVGTQPNSGCITRDGSKAYVANNGSDFISEINLQTGVVTNLALPAAALCGDCVLSVDETILFTMNSGLNTVSRIVLSPYAITSIPLAGSPSSGATDPLGRWILVVDYSSNVYKIDPNTSAVATVDMSPAAGAYDVCIDAQGHKAYIAYGFNVNLSTLELATDIIGTIPTGVIATSIAISPDGTILFSDTGSSTSTKVVRTSLPANTVSVIDLGAGNDITNFAFVPGGMKSVGVYPHAPGKLHVLDNLAIPI